MRSGVRHRIGHWASSGRKQHWISSATQLRLTQPDQHTPVRPSHRNGDDYITILVSDAVAGMAPIEVCGSSQACASVGGAATGQECLTDYQHLANMSYG
jgi:hypothetical protein